VTLSGRNVKVTQEVNDAPLPVAFDTLNLSADLHNNRAELGWLIRLTNNGQLDGQVQVTDPQGRRNLGGNVNISNFSLAMMNPIFARRKSGGMLNANLRLAATCKARSCSARCSSAAWISTVTLCRLICSRASWR
jgi:translocation and assembly module TamB